MDIAMGRNKENIRKQMNKYEFVSLERGSDTGNMGGRVGAHVVNVEDGACCNNKLYWAEIN